ATAIRHLLDALGVPQQRIPAEFDAQTSLYRSELAGRRLLVVLDNAASAEQVRPLIPGAPGCFVVVTSRNPLSGLVAVNGAHSIPVDVLPRREARELLARRIAHGRLAAERAAADDIITRCARLPLALAIVIARAAAHPDFPLATLAEQLPERPRGLDALAG